MYEPALSDLQAADALNPRHGQVALGPSDSGGCVRQHAYAHHLTPMSDPERSLGEARLGTLIHKGYSATVQALRLPGRETDVHLDLPGLRAGGTADDVDWQERIVRDVKTAKHRTWLRWATYGVPERWWEQVEIYGYGCHLRQPGPWTLALLVIDRETGDELPLERPADPARGLMLLHQLVMEQDDLDSSERPEEFPRQGHGPGRGMPCDWCPWLRECWGEQQGVLSPQARTIVADARQIEQVALDYLDAAEVEGKAREAKADARAYLEGLPSGVYGTATLGWQGGNVRGDIPDPDAMVEVLNEYDIPVPTRPGGTTARSIRVTRTPPKPVL